MIEWLDWLSGALVLSGLWLNDELLTLARYCGASCGYPLPLLGVWSQYDAEGLGWAMVFAGFAALLSELAVLRRRLKNGRQ